MTMNIWTFDETAHQGVHAMYEIARRVALTNAPVLIQGETGTGKEVLAKYIHQLSKQKDQAFVAVNCAAMPETMVEAILFGYEKGSFTNAINSYAGKFEQADGGTLLLDEIADLPLSAQAKLLRVLQEQEVERLGAKQSLKVNVRIIAATNQSLIQRVRENLFRQDLFYRLNVISLTCLPLRERKNDILPMTNYFIAKYCELNEFSLKTLSDHAKAKIEMYDWPGNIRELENTVQRAVILSNASQIEATDIQLETQLIEKTEVNSLKDYETDLILSTLKASNGLRSVAAEKLKISPRTLRHKLMKLKQIGLDIP